MYTYVCKECGQTKTTPVNWTYPPTLCWDCFWKVAEFGYVARPRN